ncbi:glutathione S-transferase pi-like protein [Coleophoma crateriformis]|uniref:Glutathione S-transferase pi-like protein n=1 Tax=Coleophoma crateriformis TaxID=565419 RepID=A0A3D8RPM6_9HELO|nr:glutathione S-transferase pi-like protein [Coleophoma crateriformis]
MPTTKVFGTESATNKAIGGIPTIHYFDFLSRGRGQVVRLMLIDAGAAYKDVRYSFDEYPELKQHGVIAKMNPTGNVPIVEMPDGKILTQSYSILRHWSRLFSAYDGKTEEEMYFADVVCDIVIDWRTLFLAAFFSANKAEDYPKHKSGKRKHFLDALERHLNSSDLSCRGPFVIGKEITYADLVLFQILHDEELTRDGKKGLQSYPRLAQLASAVEGRPNVKAFLESDAYLG